MGDNALRRQGVSRTSYTVFWVQSKMKMGGAHFQKNREKVLLKILTYKTFFSSTIFLTTCHGIFYLLFNVVLSKGKIKI